MKNNDFELDIIEGKSRLINIKNEVNQLKNDDTNVKDSIENTKLMLKELESLLGVQSLNIENKNYKDNIDFSWDNDLFLNNTYIKLDEKIKKEIYKKPELLPKLSKIDWTIIGIAGVIASIVDFLIVKIPKDISYLNKYEQNGSDLTKLLKSIGIDDKNQLHPMLKWCEDNFKVSFDKSIDTNLGMYPKNHRLRSLGHDPLFGLIFGTLDIINGTMTAFDKNGAIQVVKINSSSQNNLISSPIVWVGHIISDICTKQGLPIPGWAFLQMVQIGSFGEKERNIAQISEWMYINGYDLRHFATMSTVPAIIEMIIRAYHGLILLDNEGKVDNISKSIAEREFENINNQLKLNKMLFLAHGFATSSNAIKVWANAGNPMAINVAQWSFFIKEGVYMGSAITRDITLNQVIKNRENINSTWDEIKEIEIKKLEY